MAVCTVSVREPCLAVVLRKNVELSVSRAGLIAAHSHNVSGWDHGAEEQKPLTVTEVAKTDVVARMRPAIMSI